MDRCQLRRDRNKFDSEFEMTTNENLFAKARRVLREEGYVAFLKKAFDYFSFQYYRVFKSSRTFKFQGNTFSYFYHMYNATWRNERAVEVPIVWHIVRGHYGETILEVGNVLSHYFPVDHDILDKYEEAMGVINRDVASFQPGKEYDLIVSISTLEHIGWDEKPRVPKKLLRAIKNLESLLASHGRIVCTLPLGYNPRLDEMLRQGKIRFTRFYCLKRTSKIIGGLRSVGKI